MADFWKQKMVTYFKRIDFDHDGAITEKDFKDMADRFISTGKFDEKQCCDLKSTLLALWEYYSKEIGGGKSLDQDSFIKGMQKIVDDPSHTKTLEGPLPLFFHAVDSNCDGMIDEGEYAKFFDILGLKPEMAPDSFKAIDTNSDGFLSLDEFKEAGVLFFTCKDESSPTKFFWGPLE